MFYIYICIINNKTYAKEDFVKVCFCSSKTVKVFPTYIATCLRLNGICTHICACTCYYFQVASIVQKGSERKQLLIAIIVMVSIKSSYYVLTEDAKVFHCLKLLYSFQCKIGKISVS